MAAGGLDPRTGPVEVSPRPVVARDRAGLSNWMIAAGVLVAGLILFVILDARRRQLSAPATIAPPADRRAGGEPPTLYVPPVIESAPVVVPPPPPPPLPPPPAQPKTIYVPAPPVPQPPQAQPQPQRGGAEPLLVLDTTTGDAVGPAVGTGDASAPAGAAVATGSSLGGRARASVLRNRATTVPQGAIIPAVLETALDSTRPGPARALVTRDVRGFDGSKVLVPRGSRLIGEYKADLQPGQNRALVIWNRLVRPDGVTIEMGSPSADPLGRVGIKGKVNSHFLERFGNAFLQTALSIGGSLAASGLAGNNNNVAILALPGTVNSATSPLVGTQDIKPTLRVKQGVSVSVFVARDLDFTAVEGKK
jgi:type IV secretion system protein VirB10